MLLATATPSFALFGLGDIVFDPTSYGSLISQGATALNQLRTNKNNVTHFSFKQQWQTTLTALKDANVKNLFGETDGMSTALNSNSPSASTMGWKTATLPVDSTTSSYLQSRQLATARSSQLCHDRDVGFGVAGLTHGSWTISDDSRPERKRKRVAFTAAVRRVFRYQQRGSAVEPHERSLCGVADDCCEHAAAEHRRPGPKYGGGHPGTTSRERHQCG